MPKNNRTMKPARKKAAGSMTWLFIAIIIISFIFTAGKFQELTGKQITGKAIVDEKLFITASPTMTSVRIEPVTAYTQTKLIGLCNSTDPESDNIIYSYRWFVNDAEISNGTSPTYPHETEVNVGNLSESNFVRSDEVILECSASDANTTSAAMNSSDTTILNTLPIISNITVLPDPAFANDTLTCSYVFFDADNDTDNSEITWYDFGILEEYPWTYRFTGGGWHHPDRLVDGDWNSYGYGTRTNDTLWLNYTKPAGAVREGSKWVFKGWHDVGEFEPVLPPACWTQNPLQLRVVVKPVRQQCWNGTGYQTLSQGWYSESVDFYEEEMQWGITETGSDTLNNTSIYKSGEITCQVTPNDGFEYGDAGNSTTLTISNQAPSVANIYITPDPAQSTDTLTCNYIFSDPDDDADRSQISWYNDSGVISGQNAKTLTNTVFKRNDNITCRVTAYDGTDPGNSENSSAVQILNSAPSITFAEIYPHSARDAEDIFLNYTFFDHDNDSDMTTFRWFSNGTLIPGENSTNLSNNQTTSGYTIIAELTPHDGITAGIPVNTSILINCDLINYTINLSHMTAQEGDRKFTLYSAGTDIVERENITISNATTFEICKGTYDFMFSTYNDVLKARFNNINLNSDTNHTIYVDVLPLKGTSRRRFTVDHAQGLTPSEVHLGYAGAIYLSETYLLVKECPTWNRSVADCGNSWQKKSFTLNTTSKHLIIGTTTSKGFGLFENVPNIGETGSAYNPPYEPPEEPPEPFIPPPLKLPPPPPPPPPEPIIEEPPMEIVTEEVTIEEAVKPEDTIICSNIETERQEEMSVDDVMRLFNIPEGYKFAIRPFKAACSGGESFTTTVMVPDTMEDIQIYRCSEDGCSQKTVREVDTICEGQEDIKVGQRIEVRKELESVAEEIIIATEKDAKDGTLQMENYEAKSTDNSIEQFIISSQGQPIPKNTNMKIVGRPMEITLKEGAHKPIDVVMPYTMSPEDDESSVSIYVKTTAENESRWLFIKSKLNRIENTVSTTIDPKIYAQHGKIVVAPIATTCKECGTSEFLNRYTPVPDTRQAIILLHGLWGAGRVWDKLINQFKMSNQPFQLWTFSYLVTKPLEETATDLANYIEANSYRFDKLYIVGYSLGGIMTQAALEYAKQQTLQNNTYQFLRKLDKVILVGTPTRGSPIATYFDTFATELANSESNQVLPISDDTKFILAKGIDVEPIKTIKYYAIAGTKPYDFIDALGLDKKLFQGDENDGIVSVSSAQGLGSTNMDEQCIDFWSRPVSHTEILNNKDVLRIIGQVIASDIYKDLAATEEDIAAPLFGYSDYFEFSIDNCQPDEFYIGIGRDRNDIAKFKRPAYCYCGNDICDGLEDENTCPNDCLPVEKPFVQSLLENPYLLLALLVLGLLTAWLVYLIKDEEQEQEQELIPYVEESIGKRLKNIMKRTASLFKLKKKKMPLFPQPELADISAKRKKLVKRLAIINGRITNLKKDLNRTKRQGKAMRKSIVRTKEQERIYKDEKKLARKIAILEANSESIRAKINKLEIKEREKKMRRIEKQKEKENKKRQKDMRKKLKELKKKKSKRPAEHKKEKKPEVTKKTAIKKITPKKIPATPDEKVILSDMKKTDTNIENLQKELEKLD